MKKQLVLYIRTGKGGDSKKELEEKRQRLQNFASDQRIEEYYEDCEKSVNEYRPAYCKLIKGIFNGKVKTILIAGGPQELTRDVAMWEQIQKKVEVISIYSDNDFSYICTEIGNIIRYEKEEYDIKCSNEINDFLINEEISKEE